jgi:succinate-acetate transporter protein
MFFVRPALRPSGVLFPEMGFWFIAAAAISWVLALAAMGQRKALAAVIMSVSVGATFSAVGLLSGVAWCAIVGGYFFILSSLCALYDASAQVVKEVYGHEVLKLGYAHKVPEIMAGEGEPGVIHGQ